MSRDSESIVEGRREVIEALRAGREIEKIFVLEQSQDGPIQTVKREAKKRDIRVESVSKSRLDQISPNSSGKHQGVIAYVAAYEYSSVDDILSKAADKDEEPFVLLLDGIEDPQNLGAIIRTANVCGAHGVIIPKHGAAGLTAAAAKASAGAINYTPVARVTNLVKTMEDLKKSGLWLVGADMGGTSMYKQDLGGPIGIVIGSEGKGLGRLVREKCDFLASVPVRGEIESLNASVAAAVVAYEVVRRRVSSKRST